ncbi:MAG TPA: SMC family ATPase [Flavobacterium sp.]|nr:SMC family ATPase [Flavobacterium sp.]
MIPVQLTIEGLYSYQKRQTIDFSKLTEVGLFGIFGAVGSGKSSILEAITFALYGETERLNSKERRSYNMMNLKSDRAYIEFDFLNFENKKFRATREFRRNSKRFEDIKTVGTVFYEWKDEDWIPLTHTKAEEIIGLSYENFKRTIIIPQGQFKEFIELGAKDRTQMMKEIFNLHRFDLQHKIAGLNQSNLIEISRLEGKLSGFNEISEDQIAELKGKFKQQNDRNNILQKELNTAKERFQLLKDLKSEVENLNEKRDIFQELATQKTAKDAEKVRLELYERISQVFRPLVNEQQKNNKALENKLKDFEENTLKLNALAQNKKEIQSKLEKLQPVYDNLEVQKHKLVDYEILIEIFNLKKQVTALQERSKNGAIKVKEVEHFIINLNNDIKSLENENADLKLKILDTNILMKVGNWFVQQQGLIENQDQLQKNLQDFSDRLGKLQIHLDQEQIVMETYETDFSNTENQLITQKKSLESQFQQLNVQKRLVEFAHNLHEGKACPLCGSEEHPKVLEDDEVVQKLKKVQLEIKSLENSFQELQIRRKNVEKIITEWNIVQKNKAEAALNIENHQQKMHVHLQQFIWKDFDANNFDDFEEKRRADNALKQTIELKINEIASKRTALEKNRLEKERFQKALTDFNREESENTLLIQQNELRLKHLQWNDFQPYTADKLLSESKILEENIHKIALDYKNATQKSQENEVALAAQKASLASIEHQKIELEQNRLAIQKEVENQLTTHSITLEEVKELLQNPLDVVVLRKQLELFFIHYESLKNLVFELEQKLKDTHFDLEEYERLDIDLKAKETQWKEVWENLTKIKAELERIEKALREKQELQTTLNQLQKRADNLKILTNLFKGAGFVQYVSSVYLKQLCENANLRFHRMTKNQLSLQINENNDFEIIDYLNEGRSRSVKTLSGGQSFQVSLSLALALAESVQVHSKADKNFFFIDEGFGTQDTEAVNVVFETLNHLHKENRIVGIISHVEELKERMPVSLSVIKDENTGSSISISD